MNEIQISAYWKEDRSTASQYLDKVISVVETLHNSFKTSFPDIKLVSKEGKAESFNFAKFKDHNSFTSFLKNEDVWYIDPEGHKSTNFELNSKCDLGYYLEFLFENENECISVSISGGHHTNISKEGIEYGHNIPNSLNIEIPNSVNIEFELAQNIFNQISSTWNVYLIRMADDDLLDETYDSDLEINLGWLNYVPKLSGFNDNNFSNEMVKHIDGNWVKIQENSIGATTILKEIQAKLNNPNS